MWKESLDINAHNLSCYQCTRQANIECEPHELKQCPPTADRCVTHIMKDRQDGFKISRECGIGPCTFRDLMVIKGLGLDNCDRSRDEYFCILCCPENGCNKDHAGSVKPLFLMQLLSFIVVMIFIK
ncbi:uncharacterized protein [Atheta coriaria]|uniref:uncharacterized protein n=1 Tax=Dalotia coriaria TaxID=877792 RepID=UPI0031F3DA84